ncbi:hypothetical protein Taro_053037 [Colocasia esculenta]|uniref:Uncharacterized protein n=1 Tax=Colocasia esculenta TaxID=4460 RepID=A0A843XK45_COLES|nr:hypothetical protein [Colocasia esculenta]
MVGYADPCPLCGNNKRRRFGLASLSDDGTLLRFPLLPLPPTLRPKSKSDPTPLPAPPAAEIIVPRADTRKLASPPAAIASGCADAAAPTPGGAVPPLSLPKTPLSGRPGVTSVPPPESSGESNPMTAALPEAHPVNVVPAAGTARTSSTSLACGSRRRLGGDADGSGEKEGVNSKKVFQQGERESPCAATPREASEEEDMEVRIRCKCGRVQEFLYRQRTTST